MKGSPPYWFLLVAKCWWKNGFIFPWQFHWKWLPACCSSRQSPHSFRAAKRLLKQDGQLRCSVALPHTDDSRAGLQIGTTLICRRFTENQHAIQLGTCHLLVRCKTRCWGSVPPILAYAWQPQRKSIIWGVHLPIMRFIPGGRTSNSRPYLMRRT